MTRTPTSVVNVLVLLTAVVAVASSHVGTAIAAEADDNIPGTPLTASPVIDHLDSFSDKDDIRTIWLQAGDRLTVALNRTGIYTPTFTPNLYLYAPGTVDISLSSPIRHAEGVLMPKTIEYVAPADGLYYIDMFAPDTGTREYGDVMLAWSVLQPVYRFYNFANGTHFYTPSLDEANSVILKWSNVFSFEGVAYYTNPYNNTGPLYRFYNNRSASHFYTASLDEANNTILRYGNIFTYEGPTYLVSPAGSPGKQPVYRFYNLRNGSHFYTASASEADHVIATWPNVYQFEGQAFSLGQ
jgi:hypothetical protein